MAGTSFKMPQNDQHLALSCPDQTVRDLLKEKKFCCYGFKGCNCDTILRPLGHLPVFIFGDNN